MKTLDLRSLIPFERHSKIFELWNGLKEGETLRIINDHEPKPLYYQFEEEEKGKFEWKYEKQGPIDWIFTIKKISDRKQEIKNLIKKLKTNEDALKLKEEGKNILKNISPKELAMIEQEIINEGTTRKEMRKLCDVHLSVMKDNLEHIEMKLAPGHPIHTMMEEHKMILSFVDGLKNIKLESSKNLAEIKEIENIAKHLVEADKHHKREEDALFPMLRKFGVIEPTQIMEEEHKELKLMKKRLYKLAKNHDKMPYTGFKEKSKKLVEYIAKELPLHIYKEDNILYPMSIQAIPNKYWRGIKNDCDRIGYCCFTPTH